LLALALATPVLSQGGQADLRTAPTELALDWFLLPAFALIYTWSLPAVWGLVSGATVLLLALPWLPPRRMGTQPRQVTLHPGPVQLQVRPGETLLEAGLRAGLVLSYDCRAGGCGLCVCTVLGGRVDLGAYQPAALTDAMRAGGQALMCCAVPLEDVELEIEGAAALSGVLGADRAAGVPQRWRARVCTMERLAPEVMRLVLQLPDGQHLRFAAGQYINVLLEDGAKRAFSFAAAPPETDRTPSSDGDLIELHVRLIPGGRFTTHVFQGMKVGDALDFEGPLGRFTLHDGERPILFVAGATGFAPIKSILEDAFRRGVQRPMQLYWGARTSADLYLLDTLARWQREHPNFTFVPVLSDSADDTSWPGRHGLVHEALLADHPDLNGYEVYACGSMRMVEAAVPDFLKHGLGEQFCFSDAFMPTQRPGG